MSVPPVSHSGKSRFQVLLRGFPELRKHLHWNLTTTYVRWVHKRERLGVALYQAVTQRYSSETEIRRLLEAGANPDARGCSTLAMAASMPHGSPEIVRMLLAHGADPNRVAYNVAGPPLIIAANSSDGERLRLLMDAGADVNGIGNSGRTVLTEIVQWADVATIEYILAHGADPNGFWGQWGRSPLHLASALGRPEVVMLLLRYGADIHARTYHGKTALMWTRESLNDTTLYNLSQRATTQTEQLHAVIRLLEEAGAKDP